ncbi:hypothetical protein IW147_004192 [Coemansia sp. RSA 720]|nr:hypothetical protein IW147_004192 [Coemansia sp. RSA 720]
MDGLELRLSLCTNVHSVSEELAIHNVPKTVVVACVPEFVNGRELAALLFPDSSQFNTGEAEACVRRAEAIDVWTGRIDWVLSWLRALPTNAQIQECMRNAQILDLVLHATHEQPWTLAEINNLSDQAVIETVLELAVTRDNACIVRGLAELLDNTESNCGWWNVWWGRNMAICSTSVALDAVTECGVWFSDDVLLGLVYGAGPCGDNAEDAETVLNVVARNHGIKDYGKSNAIDMPVRVQTAVRNGDWTLDVLSDNEARNACEAGLAQAHACRVIAQLDVSSVDVTAVALCQDNEHAQRRLLTLVLRNPQALQMSVLNELCGLRVFGLVEYSEVQQLLLHALLCAEQFDDARQVLDTMGDVNVCDTVCAAARELVDNAVSGNKEHGLLKSALECLDMASDTEHSDQVEDERCLINVSHMVWQLGAPTTTLRVFQSADIESHMLPIEIRHCSNDPFVVLRVVLERYPCAYAKSRKVRELGSILVQLKSHKRVEMSVRDLAVRSLTEAFIVGLMLEAAVRQHDGKAAGSFVRQLQASMQLVLAPCMRSVEATRAQRMLGHEDLDRTDDERAVDLIWTACVDLVKCKNTEYDADPVSLALSLCPADQVPELLRLSTNSDGWQDPWAHMASPADVLHGVREMLVGSSPIPAAQPSEPVDPETMRTFDAAILRRGLRSAQSDSTLRCTLLLEWLHFAVTTVKEPSDARAQEFRLSVESEIVKRFPTEAMRMLNDRVLPELDQTNAMQVHTYYSVYAKCAQAGDAQDTVGAQQAQARAQLAEELMHIPALRNVRFDELVRAVEPESRNTSVDMLGSLVGTNVDELIALAPALVRAAGKKEPDAASLMSGLRAWRLQQLLDRAAATSDPTQFLASLSDSVDQLHADDVTSIASPIAYDARVAQAVDIDSRELALQQLPSELNSVNRARAFVQCAREVRELRDPFTFTRISDNWARAFDACGRIDPGSELTSQALEVLVDMSPTESAYIVCQTFMAVSRMLQVWAEPGFSLSTVYSLALERTIAYDGNVERVCDPPLELCEFDYGDNNELGDVLHKFRREFGRELNRVVEDQSVSSTMRLRVLRVVQQYEHADMGAMELRLLADLHWSHTVGSVETMSKQCTEWQHLLQMTNVGDRCEEQLGALVRMLDAWALTSEADVCWIQLLVWTVEHNYVAMVLPSVVRAAERVGALGNQVFPKLVDRAQSEPDLVCALAELALLFPDAQWAEPCMALVVHAGYAGDDDLTHSARDHILCSTWLHIGIVVRGFVSASCAVPGLLNAIGRTLQNSRSDSVLAYHVPGSVQPALELMCRAVHVLCEIGMHDVAVAWVYECLGVPRMLRFGVRGQVDMWVRQLDVVAGRNVDVKVEDEDKHEDKGDEGTEHLESGLEDEDEDTHAWGDVDIDVDDIAQVPDAEQILDAWGDDDSIDLDADLINL